VELDRIEAEAHRPLRRHARSEFSAAGSIRAKVSV
jgi:hypothetical protein